MRTPFSDNTVLVLTGPTCVGKTSLSLAIADQVPVEIVSADSRQIYRLMDIGTAKPSPVVRRRIPHHFIDIFDPNVEFSAGEYAREARKIIREIFERRNLPLVAGGSGLYIRALLNGFFREDIRNTKLRKQLNARLEKEGIEPLFSELERVDPEAAVKLHPHNSRRVIRALEVYYTAGKPLSQIQAEQPDPAPFSWIKCGLMMERQALYARINHRVEEMFEEGLVHEVQTILEKGFSPELNALNSVGYQEVISYLYGEIDLFTCKESVKRNTRRYAKRQLTWFRKEKDIHWLTIDPKSDFSEVARNILKIFKRLRK